MIPRLWIVTTILASTFVVASPAKGQFNVVSGIIDFHETGSGKLFALRRQAGLFSPVNHDLTSFRSGKIRHDRFFPGQPTTFERIFSVPGNPESIFLVARYRATGSENRMIYRLNGTKVEWGVITQEFDDASFHQSKKGELFVYSRDGMIVRFFDGKLDHFRIPISELLKEKKGKLRPIKCVESEQGVVAFYSIVDPALKRKGMRDLVVYDNEWKTFSLADHRTGPGFFAEPRKFRIVGPKKILTVDIDSGDIAEADTPAFSIDGRALQLRPSDVLFDPQGKPLILSRHFYRSPMRYHVDSFQGGKFFHAATLKADSDERFRWSNAGVTFEYDLYRPRFSNVDSHGNWWITGSQAIWCRTPDGTWTEYGFRHGVNPPTGINNVKIDSKNRLWMMNGNKTFSRALVIDLDQLTSDKAITLSDRWQQHFQQWPLASYDDQYFFQLDRDQNVRVWKADEVQVIELPTSTDPSSAFDARRDQIVASAEDVWRIRHLEHATSIDWYRNGKQVVITQSSPRHFEEELLKNRRSLGFPEGHFDFPNRRFLLGQPKTDELDQPIQTRCPIPKSEDQFSVRHPERLARSKSRIAVRSPDGVWHTHLFGNPIEKSVLQTRNVRADNSGRLFIEKDGYYLTSASVIWFEPHRVTAEREAEKIASLTEPNQTLSPKWEFVSKDGQDFAARDEYLQYQWRADDGPWSRWLAVTERPVIYALPNQGEHNLEIRINYPGVFITNGTINFGFETSYDFGETINPLLKNLDSDSFDTRKQAAEQLARFGIGAIPELTRIAETGSPETRVTAGKLIEEITSAQDPDNQHSDR